MTSTKMIPVPELGVELPVQRLLEGLFEDFEYEMWLGGGQSNFTGGNALEAADLLPGGRDAPVPNLYMTTPDGGIVQAKYMHHFGPSGTENYTAHGVNLFWEFCRHRALLNPGRKVLMCSAGLGGTKLIGGPWDPEGPPAGGGVCFTVLRDMAIAALNSGKKIFLAGVLWQGHESDGFAGETKAAYKTKFLQLHDTLMAALPEDFSGSVVGRPWLLGGFHDDWLANGVGVNILAPVDPGVPAANMRAVHEAITDMCRDRRNFYYVRTDGLVLQPDLIHWNGDSQRELGRRYLEVAEKALAAVRGHCEYRGTWTPNTSFPVNARKGDFWVSSAQSLAGSEPGGLSFLPGDILWALTDNPRTDVYADNWLRIKQNTFESFAKVSVFTGQIVNTVSDNPAAFLKVNPLLDAIRGMTTVRQAGFEAMGTFLGQGVVANHLLFNYPATALWVHATNYVSVLAAVQAIVELVRTSTNVTWRSLIAGAAGGRFSQFTHDFDVLLAKFFASGGDAFGSGLDVAAPSMHASLQSTTRAQIRTDNATNRTTVRVNPTNVEVFSGATGVDGTKIATVKSDGDIELHVAGRGVILRSPDNTAYKATMNNGGTWNIAPA